MDGLPFIPGFRFNEITKKDYHLSAQFRWKNGYAIPKDKSAGIGKTPIDVESVQYNKLMSAVGYNPTLTYGKAKDPPKPIVQPHFIMFEGKCLSFNGYTKQTVMEPSVDTYRVRSVRITYFLVDNTISVVEPVVENAGYVQGCLLKRGHIPNPHRNNKIWHWSDLNNGVELNFYGTTYQLCNCDLFTKQFLSSQGLVMEPDKPVPKDPYMVDRQKQLRQHSETSTTTCASRLVEDDKLKQFLQYDGKVLRFYTAWNDNGSEPAEWKFFVLLYFMADDQVEIYESKDVGLNCDVNPFPVFLGKSKLPKDWSNLPSNFPSIYLETGSKEFQKYYQPNDFIIGNTILVMGRRFILYDCDLFTRNYFKEILKIDQPVPIKISIPKDSYPTVYKQVIPPYTGIGDPDDTRQNCLSLIPKPPKTLDFITYVLNASKKLRYKLKMVPVYEVDELRDFIMEFCLGNNHMSIVEVARKNSGFIKGRFMASTRLRKPGTNIDDDQFYGTKDFAIGAELHVRGSVFKIVELDLWTYNYMNKNKDMFTQDAINGAKCYLENIGLLNPQE